MVPLGIEGTPTELPLGVLFTGLTATGSVPLHMALQFHSTQQESSHRMKTTDGSLRNCIMPATVGAKGNLMKGGVSFGERAEPQAGSRYGCKCFPVLLPVLL